MRGQARWRIAGGTIAVIGLFVIGVLVATAVRDGVGPEPSATDSGEDAFEAVGDACEDAHQDDGLSRQVRLTSAGEWVEFELWSVEPFPARALFPVLRVGTREFTLSRYPNDGDMHTLIFRIPPEEFDLLTPDDYVSIYYGGAGSPPLDYPPDDSAPWSFGTFTKELLDCTAAGEA